MLFNGAIGQSLKKMPVSNSGCFFYGYCDIKFDFDYSEDSSKVYMGECANSDVNYGVVCIQLLESVKDIEKVEDLMISYLDYLKLNFEIKSAAGYGKGHRLNKSENTRGILDYWKDADGNNWKIKAWSDGKYIGVLYAYSKKELPENKVNLFLEGFRLPEM
jgi:hypothetical protein